MTPKITVHAVDAPWPFKDMEVGDIAFCMRPGATAYAHSYGQGTGKRFLTRAVKSKQGQQGYKVVRLPDDIPKMIDKNPMGRPRKSWGFDNLPVGGVWECNDPKDIPRTLSAVHRANQAHRRLTGEQKYATSARAEGGLYSVLYITRLS